jgi:hypothetical protein
MGLPDTLIKVRKSPGMYVSPLSFDAVVAFVQGFDTAVRGGLLVGFREWLIISLDEGSNLAWPVLVSTFLARAQSSAADDEQRIEGLFAAIEKFLLLCDAPEGKRRIYVSYEAWLRRQDGYTPSPPDSVDPG